VPYTCGVFKASTITLSKGEHKFWSAINNIREWLNSNSNSDSFAIYDEI